MQTIPTLPSHPINQSIKFEAIQASQTGQYRVLHGLAMPSNQQHRQGGSHGLVSTSLSSLLHRRSTSRPRTPSKSVSFADAPVFSQWPAAAKAKGKRRVPH